MFKKILFATTASPNCDNAAQVAFDLEQKWGAKLTVFHVVGMPGRGFSGQSVEDFKLKERVDYNDDYFDWVKEEMRTNYESLMHPDSNVEFDAIVGVPSTEILRKARQEDVDLIIMGSHTRKEEVGATRYRSVGGSTMHKVTKSARCPVVIISRPCTTCWKLFSNIVYGTDFSKPADSAYHFAYNLAREVGAKLHIFHALDIGYGGQLKSQESIEDTLTKAQEKIKKRYLSKMNGFDNFDVEVREGVPYVEILKFAREKQGDLIVMAHHAKQIDPEEAELGSTVEQVVLRASCPVASVNHPDKVVEA